MCVTTIGACHDGGSNSARPAAENRFRPSYHALEKDFVFGRGGQAQMQGRTLGDGKGSKTSVSSPVGKISIFFYSNTPYRGPSA